MHTYIYIYSNTVYNIYILLYCMCDLDMSNHGDIHAHIYIYTVIQYIIYIYCYIVCVILI